MIIIGFDPGLNLGYCVSSIMNLSGLGEVFSIIQTGSIKNDAKQDMTYRQQEIVNLIEKLLDEYLPDLVIVEGINRVRGGKFDNEKNESSWCLGWVFGEILRLSALRNIQTYQMNPAKMKPAALAGRRGSDKKGAVKKEEVLKLAKEMLSKKHMKTDESDAFGLCLGYYNIKQGIYVPTKSKKRGK